MITLDVNQHIARVKLCRAQKMNALDQGAFTALVEVASEIERNPAIRAVLLLAEGDHFCAGADKAFLQGAVSENSVFAERALSLKANEIANEFQKPCLAFRELGVPVIAVLQGVTYGAGLQLALAADIRIGSPTTSMSLFEINWGLIPDMAVTQTLPRLVNYDVALELMVTGRVVEADEAVQLGLLTRKENEPMNVAEQLAGQIVARSPDAVRSGKKLLRESVHLSKAQALALEAQLQAELVGSANQIEAALANIGKRPPVFTD